MRPTVFLVQSQKTCVQSADCAVCLAVLISLITGALQWHQRCRCSEEDPGTLWPSTELTWVWYGSCVALPLLGNLMIYIQILYNKNELGAPIWFRYSARVGPLGVHGKAMERTRRHRLNHNPDPDEGQTLNMRHKECIRDVIQRCVPINQIGFNGTISRCNCLCGRVFE